MGQMPRLAAAVFSPWQNCLCGSRGHSRRSWTGRHSGSAAAPLRSQGRAVCSWQQMQERVCAHIHPAQRQQRRSCAARRAARLELRKRQPLPSALGRPVVVASVHAQRPLHRQGVCQLAAGCTEHRRPRHPHCATDSWPLLLLLPLGLLQALWQKLQLRLLLQWKQLLRW